MRSSPKDVSQPYWWNFMAMSLGRIHRMHNSWPSFKAFTAVRLDHENVSRPWFAPLKALTKEWCSSFFLVWLKSSLTCICEKILIQPHKIVFTNHLSNKKLSLLFFPYTIRALSLMRIKSFGSHWQSSKCVGEKCNHNVQVQKLMSLNAC